MAGGVTKKPFKTIVLDTGPIIDNSPSISRLLSLSNTIVTIREVVGELVDEASKSRFATTWEPFVEFREPREESIRAFRELSQLTSNAPDLSDTDVKIGSLVLELECETRTGIDQFVLSARKRGLNARSQAPLETRKQGQLLSAGTHSSKHLPGPNNDPIRPKSGKHNLTPAQAPPALSGGWAAAVKSLSPVVPAAPSVKSNDQSVDSNLQPESQFEEASSSEKQPDQLSVSGNERPGDATNEGHTVSQNTVQDTAAALDNLDLIDDAIQSTSSEDDGEGDWITPSNLDQQMLKDQTHPAQVESYDPTKVALATTDLRLQNVLVHHGLNLVGPGTMRRNIDSVRTTVLRCDGCFTVTENTTKQFCPSCGHPNLKRVTALVDANGKRSLTLKKNYQHNLRGNRYSAPKPVAGTASGKKIKGGGKGGWGSKLILAEDQKGYSPNIDQSRTETSWQKLLDEDALPDMLSRPKAMSQKVGVGRNINSKKRTGTK